MENSDAYTSQTNNLQIRMRNRKGFFFQKQTKSPALQKRATKQMTKKFNIMSLQEKYKTTKKNST